MKKRLDLLIMEKYAVSRTQAARLIDTGCVIYKDKKLKNGQTYTAEEFTDFKVTIPDTKKSEMLAEDIPLKIIHEDKDLLIIHKPVGMVVHPACGNTSGTLVNALLHHCKGLSQINGIERPGIVHRIDKDTEGLLVVAKNDKTHRALSKQFEKHTITRNYLALAQGNVLNDTGTITGNLNRSGKDRKKVAVVTTGGKKAITHYKVLRRFNSATLLEISLETGRTHQIRVHMAYIGHPLIGDPVYNRDYLNKNTVQYLVAYRLGFVHPTSRKYIEFTAELPEWAKKYSA